jgi:L-fuconolactonase
MAWVFPNKNVWRMAVDTHVHFWQYQKDKDAWITDDMNILQQDFFPENLIPVLQSNGVNGCVAVQASSSEAETGFLVTLAKKNPFIRGVVGWIDFQNENIKERLQYFANFSIIKGWRHVVQSEPDDFLLRKEFLKGIAALKDYNYTYDILIYPQQLAAANEFVMQFPDLKMVIDHAAKPNIALQQIDNWEAGLKTIAKHKNIYCKISGLFTEAIRNKWDASIFYPYLDIVFAAFGCERILFGSDWPVLQLSGTYRQWKELVENYMINFSIHEKELVFTKNAENFYQL